MYKRMYAGLNKIIQSKSIEEKGLLIEQLLIANYGSYDKAKIEIERLRDANPNENDFSNALYKELNLEGFKKLETLLSQINSLPELIEYAHKVNSGEIVIDISKEEAKEMLGIYENWKPQFSDTIANEESDHLINTVFVEEFAQKIRFTLKEIRIQIGVNQRTFTKWLKYYFKNKFDGVRTISLTEYILIYKQLMLKEGEDKFDFEFKAEEYFQRLNEGLVFSKERLKDCTESDYKTLAENCKKVIPNYKNMDIFPFNLAYKILERMS